jgi:type II secretory ATPase GspE/PulE/Tfp pilus assembly ATPase PilB-like protein
MQLVSKPSQHIFYTQISIMQLNDEQKKVLHSVIENPQGLHIITSTFGSNKTFFIKYIT